MKILALEKELPGSTSDDFAKYAEAEALKVWDLIQKNKIREIYFRDDEDNAVIVLECRDISEAEKILAELPFVSRKLIEFEIIPLKPYPGLNRLFN